MLQEKDCTPCRGGIPPINPEEARKMLREVPMWKLIDDSTKLYREFTFKDFAKALEFTNKVGELAEAEQHHPDIELGWGYVNIKIFTHKINGLHENDFILASKIDRIRP